MGQNPDITPYTTSGVQDRIAREGLGASAWSDLGTDRQSDLEAVIDERFLFVYKVAERLTDDDISANNLPDEFQVLFFEEAVYGVIRSVKGEEAAEKRRGKSLARTWENVLAHYSPAAPSGAQTSTTYKNIDRFVTAAMLRLSARVMVPIHVIDQHTKAFFEEIWNANAWEFRRREWTFTIDTNGNLQGADGDVQEFGIDQTTNASFRYKDSTTETLRWVSPEILTRLRAEYAGETGRPKWFRFQNDYSNGQLNLGVVMVPDPDQSYTVYGSVVLKCPALPPGRTTVGTFAALPAEYHPVLWSMVLGAAMRDYGERADRRIGMQRLKEARKKLDDYGEAYTDFGRPPTDLRPTDVTGILNDLGTSSFSELGQL